VGFEPTDGVNRHSISSYLKASSYEFTRVTLGEDKIPQTRINKGFSGTNADISAHEHTAMI
jgi:hypothetical protein